MYMCCACAGPPKHTQIYVYMLRRRRPTQTYTHICIHAVPVPAHCLTRYVARIQDP